MLNSAYQSSKVLIFSNQFVLIDFIKRVEQETNLVSKVNFKFLLPVREAFHFVIERIVGLDTKFYLRHETFNSERGGLRLRYLRFSINSQEYKECLLRVKLKETMTFGKAHQRRQSCCKSCSNGLIRSEPFCSPKFPVRSFLWLKIQRGCLIRIYHK